MGIEWGVGGGLLVLSGCRGTFDLGIARVSVRKLGGGVVR